MRDRSVAAALLAALLLALSTGTASAAATPLWPTMRHDTRNTGASGVRGACSSLPRTGTPIGVDYAKRITQHDGLDTFATATNLSPTARVSVLSGLFPLR